MTVVASGYERKHLDLYETEPWATEALLRHLPVVGKVVWEPAAGNHMMADVFRANGATVRTSDIARYERDHDEIVDFLNFEASAALLCPDAIITNPPYGKGNRDAVRWAERCLLFCPGHVALLLTAKFDFGKTRRHLFADCDRFMAKIALLDRIQWFPGETSGTEDHAWYVWGPVGETHVPRLYWEGRTA